MAEFALQVTTGDVMYAGTLDNLYVTLIGSDGPSEHTHLTSVELNDKTGKVGSYSVTSLFSLGCLLLLKLENDPFHESLENEWFCSKIVVKTPEEDEILFPCYRWLSRGESVLLRGGGATKAFEDADPQLVDERKKELVHYKSMYKWDHYTEGMSYILYLKDPKVVPADIRFSYSKAFQISYISKVVQAELKKKGLKHAAEQWESIEAMKAVSWFSESPISEYVLEHWKDDDFFGYQFLNLHPVVIQRCSKLPSNFPVTEEMVKPFLANGSSLTVEMKMGNIFIGDYKIMEGLPTRVLDGKPLVMPAPFCLLYLNPDGKLLPIAIQLTQQPSDSNPIFLPSDTEFDWLLAKIFVRHADALYHNLVSHLQRTHLLSEAFTVATIRNLPKIHPLYKLLTPHHRHTINTNVLSRAQLYGPGRSFENTTLGNDGIIELFRRGLLQTTYTSLCLPESIAARGLESIPNFYYRDDALRLWSIINRFVERMMAYYYPSDNEVSADSELQGWINEIYYYGFLENIDSGIPSNFQTVEELIKFVTMVIFTSSCQHSAVNNAVVPLGTYPEQRFDEPATLQMIQDFQAELSSLSVTITKRNSELELPYNYLNPTQTENSITI